MKSSNPQKTGLISWSRMSVRNYLAGYIISLIFAVVQWVGKVLQWSNVQWNTCYCSGMNQYSGILAIALQWDKGSFQWASSSGILAIAVEHCSEMMDHFSEWAVVLLQWSTAVGWRIISVSEQLQQSTRTCMENNGLNTSASPLHSNLPFHCNTSLIYCSPLQ